MPLPPVVQQFAVQADSFLAGIDAMLAETDKLVAEVDAAVASAERLSASGPAVAASMDEQAAATARAAETANVYVDAQGRLRMANGQFASSAQRAALSADELAAAYDRAGMSANAAGDKAEASGKKAATFGGAWKTAALGVALALGYGIDQAAKFQASTTRLVTSANETDKNLGMVRSGLLTMAGQVGETATALAKGMYTVESAGYHGAQGLIVMRAAAQGARDENADLATVANAVTDVLVDYHLKASAAADVTSKLVEAVSFGKTNFQDFSASMSIILPLASSLHLKFADVAGVEAEMTSHGISADEAAQQMANTMRHLMNPTKIMAKNLAEFGLSAKDLTGHLASAGLGGTLQWLRGVAEKLAPSLGMTVPEALAKMLGSASGLQVALATTGENAKGTNAAIAGIGKASKDAQGNVKGFADVQKTFGFQLSSLKAGAQALAISFGTVLLPAATKVIGMLAKFAGMLEQHPALAKFAGALLAVAVGFKVAAVAESMFTAVTDANPIMLAVMAVIALAAGLYELYKHSKLVRDVVADVGHFFASVWRDAMRAAGAVVNWFVTGPLAFIKQQLHVFEAFWAQHGAQIEHIARAAWMLIKDAIVTYWRVIWDGEIHPGLIILEAAWRVVWGIVRDTVKMAWNVIAAVIRTAVKLVLDVISLGLDLLTGKWGKAWGDLKTLVSDAIHGVISILDAFISGSLHLLWDAGVNIVKGLIDGIKSMFGAVGSIIGDLGSGIVGGFKAALHIFSPSRVFYELGGEITRGLALGIGETAHQAVTEARKLAAAVRDAYYSGQIKGTQEEQLLQRIDTGLAGLERRIAARRAAFIKTMQEIGLKMQAGLLAGLENASSAAQAKTAVDKLVSLVQQAFRAGAISYQRASGLTAWLEADSTRLQALAARRQRLTATIKAADAYAASTSQNVQQWAGLSNITGSMTSGGLVYSGNILAGMQADLSRIRAFGVAVKRLGKLGLRRDLINQIIQMGPDQGLQVAQALIDGPASVIAQMNKTEAGIVAGSNQLGAAAANAMYDTGKNAGKGFLSGLLAEERQLAAMFDRLARGMIDSVDRGLGIHPGGGHGRHEVHHHHHEVHHHHKVEVHGYVGSERQLAEELYRLTQQEALRHSRRNGLNNGFSLA